MQRMSYRRERRGNPIPDHGYAPRTYYACKKEGHRACECDACGQANNQWEPQQQQHPKGQDKPRNDCKTRFFKCDGMGHIASNCSPNPNTVGGKSSNVEVNHV